MQTAPQCDPRPRRGRRLLCRCCRPRRPPRTWLWRRRQPRRGAAGAAPEDRSSAGRLEEHVHRRRGEAGEDGADHSSHGQGLASAGTAVASALSGEPVHGGADEERAEAAPEGEHLPPVRSEEHTSELQSLMRISYAVFCLKKKTKNNKKNKIR